ncbi:hypothetical protein KIN20_023794 [Parelaphostrongylus tenuis]|uniref:SXP/RAL-2 family protein Ani s 5-like cation-binding domain-containing protein n=1 Tax=Parelaphostrongylus tenuis TaxID=148309 RepID=A0AAD5N7J3_PARTN|nr:hypothetical protein KIN20_015803 [Parelaphostrongylus tenuis]KAJ1363847.1 hypothetical protein KIN20_023794 [Parelaphostrongylus tenuis]
MEKSLERWAKKYNIEDKYKAHVADENKKFEAFKKSLTDLTKKLTAFFKSYIKIGNDKMGVFDDRPHTALTEDLSFRIIISSRENSFCPTEESKIHLSSSNSEESKFSYQEKSRLGKAS